MSVYRKAHPTLNHSGSASALIIKADWHSHRLSYALCYGFRSVLHASLRDYDEAMYDGRVMIHELSAIVANCALPCAFHACLSVLRRASKLAHTIPARARMHVAGALLS